jgi:hypothetical protein
LLTAKAITVDDIIKNHIKAIQPKKTGRINAAESDLYNYAETGHEASLEGTENINGRNCYKIRIKNKSANVVHYLIDAENWYIIRKYIRPADDHDKTLGTNRSYKSAFNTQPVTEHN